MNLTIREFEQKLIHMINAEELPIELKRLVVKDIYNQLESESAKVINAEIEEMKSKESGETEDGNQL